jgi:hypothetical protein
MMATRKKASEEKKAEEPDLVNPPEEPETLSTEEVYSGYSPPAVPDQVEVRINNKIVFLNGVYGARLEALASGGVSVKGSSEPPKASKKSSPELYNPEQDESATATQMAPVPVTDPEYTEALDESATPDDDGQ